MIKNEKEWSIIGYVTIRCSCVGKCRDLVNAGLGLITKSIACLTAVLSASLWYFVSIRLM